MSRGHNLFVGFDLVHPMDNYERLARTLVTLGSPVKVTSMLWYLDTELTAREAEAALRDACNNGDSLIVIDASTNTLMMHNLPVPAAGIRKHWNASPLPTPPPVPAELPTHV